MHIHIFEISVERFQINFKRVLCAYVYIFRRLKIIINGMLTGSGAPVLLRVKRKLLFDAEGMIGKKFTTTKFYTFFPQNSIK